LANDILVNISQDDIQRAHFRSRHMYRMDYNHDMTVRYNKGLAEGKAEGEHQKAVSVARSMLADAMSVDIVSKFTGLSVEELNQLRA
jgi:predicted transposase/invertase (TIGR01784 family)